MNIGAMRRNESDLHDQQHDPERERSSVDVNDPVGPNLQRSLPAKPHVRLRLPAQPVDATLSSQLVPKHFP
jgi:hypothetical protein